MKAKVLVVDDSMTTRLQLRRAIEGAGFSVVEAYDGIHAHAKLVECEAIAVIVCDINMPRMNGLEFLEQLERTENAAIPVVVLTNDPQPERIRQAKALGAKGWIGKPFKAELVVATVRKLAVVENPAGRSSRITP
jgi:two-component system chemotaxis response regulator CheY